jgi:hypothetical protein
MLNENELLKLIRDMEADNIERTTTTKIQTNSVKRYAHLLTTSRAIASQVI